MSENKLEFKIVNDVGQTGIRLSNMSLGASKALKVLLEALTKIVEQTPDFENIRLNISEGSAIVAALATDDQIETIQDQFEAVANAESTNESLIKAWRDVQGLITLNGLDYEVNIIRNNIRTNITPTIKSTKKFRVKPNKRNYTLGYSFLHGKLNEAGGKNPNIHILEIVRGGSAEKETIVDCEENEVERIIRFIYKPIYISAWSRKSDASDQKLVFCDLYNDSVLFNDFKTFFNSFTSLSEPDRLSLLHEKLYMLINDKEFNALRKFLRLFNNESEDVNILKTVCVVTKGIKNNSTIKEVREQILMKLNTALKTSFH